MLVLKQIRRSVSRPVNLLLVVMSVLLVGIGNALAENYDIDPVHTQVMFRVKHMGIGFVTGRFANFRGSLGFDQNNISNSTVNAEIASVSIDTDNIKRDSHLRSPDFLDADRHPQLSFSSTRVHSVNGDNFFVDGDLSIRGVTRPITLKAKYLGSVLDHERKDRIAFQASANLNRKDFGLTWNQALEAGGWIVGEKVSIILEVQGIRNETL